MEFNEYGLYYSERELQRYGINALELVCRIGYVCHEIGIEHLPNIHYHSDLYIVFTEQFDAAAFKLRWL